MIGSPFVTNCAGNHDEARKREVGRDAAGRCQTDDKSRPSGVELFCNQHGIRSTDRPCDDPARHAFQFHRKHGCVETSPRREHLGDAFPHKPVRKISVKVEDADVRNFPGRDLACPAHVVDQALGGEAGRLL